MKSERVMQHMELKNTIEMMCSDDYKTRFQAEYNQLTIRIAKLRAMLVDWGNGKLDFEPVCPFSYLNAQLSAMEAYQALLEGRAGMEGIDLLLE